MFLNTDSAGGSAGGGLWATAPPATRTTIVSAAVTAPPGNLECELPRRARPRRSLLTAGRPPWRVLTPSTRRAGAAARSSRSRRARSRSRRRGRCATRRSSAARIERLVVLARADDERKAEPRAIGGVGRVEARELGRREAVEARRGLLAARGRGQPAFARDAPGEVGVRRDQRDLPVLAARSRRRRPARRAARRGSRTAAASQAASAIHGECSKANPIAATNVARSAAFNAAMLVIAGPVRFARCFSVTRRSSRRSTTPAGRSPTAPCCCAATSSRRSARRRS